ncbi:TRAP transporter substrate-binding protein [Malaciobacter halophilus]|uniref:TRAP transporter substrate-binding protein n=1 Tax=Malaciobacter halophilus TaxID=197482 RepID=A0A2N1J280_9BACT|nr:TAXI family TRAP transporter solute-binding subunit [Malaciobacter halophilus]AXH09333.1 TRAP transporter, substrate binding protein, TAXI family [Malaciobacter halophilus]PKI80677.1 TRAP transporter substrate-binding protein [Malaciobacter halophilus]
MKIKALTIALIASTLVSNLSAQRVTLKAAKSSSSYYQMAVQVGENIAKATNKELSITIEESQGSVQNVKEVRKRVGNYVFTTPPVLLKLAKTNKAMFKTDNSKDYEKVRALFPMPYLTMHIVVRKDSNINSFEDLKGKSLLVGKGSFGAREAKKYIKLFGLREDVKLINAELSGAVAALKNGQIDGFATSGSYPAPNVIEAAASANIKILNMSDEQIALTKRDKIVIPAKTYANIDEDIKTTTLPVGVYTTTNMSEDTAYKFTKAFWESKKALEKQNIWWKAISFENLSMFSTKLHKGALKYYKEVNANIPEGIK